MFAKNKGKIDFSDINVCLTFTFILLAFLLAGTEYLSWFYSLSNYFEGDKTYIVGKICGYSCQVLGIIIAALLAKTVPGKIIKKPLIPVIAVSGQLVCVFLFFFIDNSVGVMLSGFLLNFFIGISICVYSMMLSSRVPTNIRGIVYGLGIGLASVGSWVISLIGKGNFLQDQRVLLAYILITSIAAIIVLIAKLSIADSKAVINEDEEEKPKGNIGISTFVSMGLIIMLFGIVNELSDSFPTTQVVTGEVHLELIRAFYAVGLITAGVLSDIKRQNGAVACMVLLVTPFIMLALRDYLPGPFVVLMIIYIVGAFYSVFRTLYFADLFDKDSKFLFLAGGGLIFGRVGECIGSAIEMKFKDNVVAIVLIAGVLFGISFVLFMNQIIKQVKSSQLQSDNMTSSINSDKKENEKDATSGDFAAKYNLSAREVEVFALIVEGATNIEISEKLFISINTVKFHMKNILKKTECANRNELLDLYSK